MNRSLLNSSAARQSARAGVCAIAALVLGTNIACAAEGGQSGSSEVVFLAQLVTLMVVAIVISWTGQLAYFWITHR